MLITDAFAQTGAPAGAPDATTALLVNLFPIVAIFAVFYFLMIRPQQKRFRAHQEMIKNLKRGDVVVTSGGLIGKIKSVTDDEVRVELATNVEVRVIRSTIQDVRTKGEPAPANDSKPAKAD
jgi:preprotein translocase subunit YajC